MAQKARIQSRIDNVLEHGQYIMGPEVREMEERLEEFSGARHCIAVSSGTEALLISLMAIGIRPGDEVITTPFSFIATAEVIVLLGAKPVFADIELETCNINPSAIEEKITPHTRAIMPVSLYGQPADMDEINEIAERNGRICVIEDAAQSFGATLGGKRSCNLSKIGCTSFFPSKPLGCYGDGGAIFTSDQEIADRCRRLRVHGQSERYVHDSIGVGGRMDTLQCAIVLAKLEQFNAEIDRRQEIAERYYRLLNNRLEGGELLPWPAADRTSVFAQFSLRVDSREKVRTSMEESGVPTSVHYPMSISRQPAYRRFAEGESFPVADETAEKIISLPMHPALSEKDQIYICDQLERSLLAQKLDRE